MLRLPGWMDYVVACVQGVSFVGRVRYATYTVPNGVVEGTLILKVGKQDVVCSLLCCAYEGQYVPVWLHGDKEHATIVHIAENGRVTLQLNGSKATFELSPADIDLTDDRTHPKMEEKQCSAKVNE